ncbi:MAG: hypothetical protein LLG06_13130 [Desulfobacteraceae bacterium]|nr:hypothetical protein [Desulfobacteraceae bacterium]
MQPKSPEAAVVSLIKERLSRHSGESSVPYEDYEFLADEYEKLLCRLDKIIIISDKYEIELKEATHRLDIALAHVNQLRSIILPICMYCKRIRTDGNYWQQVESYFREHIDVMFSHGICPECLMTHYGKTLPESKLDESGSRGPAGPEA